MSIALIPDRINVAQDAPFALGVAVWSDLLRTQAVSLKNGAAYIRTPGSAQVLTCTPANGRLSISGNMAVIQLEETDLAALPAGKLYVELQWQDADGAQGRADFEAVYLIAGEGGAFAGAQALGAIWDVAFAAQRGLSLVLGLAGGPPGQSLAQAMYAAGLIASATTAAVVAYFIAQIGEGGGGVTPEQLAQVAAAVQKAVVGDAPTGWTDLGSFYEQLGPPGGAGLKLLGAAGAEAARNVGGVFGTRASAAAAAAAGQIDASLDALQLLGFSAQGDHPTVTYRQVPAQPAHAAWFPDKSGVFWELGETDVDPRYLGAVPDATFFADATTAAGSTTVTFTTSRFSTADVGKAIGILGAGPPVAASAWVFFLQNPASGDTIKIGATTITFGSQVAIGATPDVTAANLQAYIAANSTALGVSATVDYIALKVTANTAGTAGNTIAIGITVAVQTYGYAVFTPSPFLSGGLANGLLATTITGVSNPSSITVAAPASVAVYGVGGEYGTDNAAAITAALGLTGTLTPFGATTVPPGTTDAGFGAAGSRRVVFRSSGLGRSRYGVLSEVEFNSQARLAFDGEAALCALPGFAGAAVLGTPAGTQVYAPRVKDLAINCDGFAPVGLWVRYAVQTRLEGTTRVYGATLTPVRVGYHGVHTYNTEFDHIIAVAPGLFTSGGVRVDPASAGFFWDKNATDSRIKRLLSIGYRTGYWDAGAENRCLDIHCYGGIMSPGARFDGSSFYVTNLYCDTPNLSGAGSSPDVTSQATCYGALINNQGRIENFHCFLNGTVNDATVGVQSNYQGGYPVIINGGFFSSTNVSARKFTTLITGVSATARASLKVTGLVVQPGCYTSAGVPALDDSDHQTLLVAELRGADFHAPILTGVCRLDGVKTTLTNVLRCTRASTALAQNAAGAWQAFGANQPRITTAGLYVEPAAATNTIRNSTAAGATVGTIGSGGVMPTNWSAQAASGAAYDVVGTGTENGLPYCDIRFHGSNTGGGTVYSGILFETPTAGQGAAVGQVWSASFFYRLTAGALPTSGLSSMGVNVLEYDSTGTYKGNGVGGYPVTPSSSVQRAIYPRTLQQAAVSGVATGFTFAIAAGIAWDFTVRFYVPQLEKASTASSPIITSGAAATRAAETVTFAIPAGTYDLLVSGASADAWSSSLAVPAGGYTVSTTATIKRVCTFRAGLSDAEQTWRSNALAAWTEPVSVSAAKSPWGVVTTTYQAVAGDKLLADTSAGSFAISLPASPNPGDPVEIRDAAGAWATNPLTINPGSATIAGAAGNAVLSAAWGAASYVAGTTGWTFR